MDLSKIRFSLLVGVHPYIQLKKTAEKKHQKREEGMENILIYELQKHPKQNCCCLIANLCLQEPYSL